MFGLSLYVDVAIAIATLISFVLLYFKWCYGHWERKGMEYIEPRFPFGNVSNPWGTAEPPHEAIDRCYEEFRRRGLKHGGIYSVTKPVYIPVDVQYIKNIMITDFQYFHRRAVYSNEKSDPVSAHLLTLDGQRWKNLRMKLSPVFTSGKMKNMFGTMLQCGGQMMEAIEKMRKDGKALNIKEISACYATNVIGSCGFGIDCDSFGEGEMEFRQIGKRFLHFGKLRRFLRMLTTNYPEVARFLNLRDLPKEVSDFYMRLARECVDHRKKNKITRNDALQTLMNVHQELETSTQTLGKEAEDARKPLTIGEIAANYFLFFVAGFETSSTTLSFLFYELSRNQDVQDKMRDEIETVLGKHGGEINYESLQDMKYMRQAFDETLRKYPVIPTIRRKSTADYKIPGTDLTLDKDTLVYISVNGMHRNPDYFPEPDRFDPDRFSDENKGNIKAGTYLGFGEGPRICLGKRFGLMQLSIAVVLLLKVYRVKPNMEAKAHLKLDTNSMVQTPKGGLWVNLEKI